MCSDWFVCYLVYTSITLTTVLITGEYLTQGCKSIMKLMQPPRKRVVVCHTRDVMVLLCKLEMSHMEGDWKGLLTMKCFELKQSALQIRNMLVHQVPEEICARDREPVGS